MNPTIPEDILNRKGARKVEDVPDNVMELLNQGKLETVNLTEWLGVDQIKLLKVVLQELETQPSFASFLEALNNQKKPTANSNTKIIGQTFGLLFDDHKVFKTLSDHASDVVRCWACWAEALKTDTTPDLLDVASGYAADPHFGVREVVIFATKDRLAEDLELSISLLEKWTSAEDENVRRYAVETLRPIGVWTKKIEALQKGPHLGLPILEPLKADPSKYVQNSVANWLNDASKSNPDWVQEICEQWTSQSSGKETAYIVKRGLRSINKG